MLFHQRIDYSPPSLAQKVYLRIPLTSTLWTSIESRGGESTSSTCFPSRILKPDAELSAVFTGVDTTCLLQAGMQNEYRIIWRIIPDPQDPNPETLICLPLESPVTFTFCHGNSHLLSLGLGGIDVMLYFDRSTRILSTSWFTPPLSTTWTLELPKRLIARVVKSIWEPLLGSLQDVPSITSGPTPDPEEDGPQVSYWSKLRSLCCLVPRRFAGLPSGSA